MVYVSRYTHIRFIRLLAHLSCSFFDNVLHMHYVFLSKKTHVCHVLCSIVVLMLMVIFKSNEFYRLELSFFFIYSLSFTVERVVVCDARRFVDDFLIDFLLNNTLLMLVSVIVIAVIVLLSCSFLKKQLYFRFPNVNGIYIYIYI
jgi:hypothetical protein